jgi:hypothetical protein
MTRAGLAVAIFSLVLPELAWAQESPPPAEPPPAVPAPPTSTAAPPTAHPPQALPAPPVVTLTRYSRYRSSWYIGFALGGGGGWVSFDEADATEGGGGMALSIIKVGWIARPWLLLGAEISTTFHFEGDLWWSSTWVQLAHYDLVATFFPVFDKGFYLKGGAGAGFCSVESSTLFGTQDEQRTEHGGDVRLGVGYEWQLRKSFNLGAELAYGLLVFKGGRGHDLAAQLTLTWY